MGSQIVEGGPYQESLHGGYVKLIPYPQIPEQKQENTTRKPAHWKQENVTDLGLPPTKLEAPTSSQPAG
ncbi:hypothetical protein QYF36_008197 [Acer negundo]|nr:hypothetical protein QYF36_008197 [Acer negundo]